MIDDKMDPISSINLIQGKNISDVWERAVLYVFGHGRKMYTEYDQWSKDASMLMVVDEPFSEPRIHRGGLCGGLGDLARYVKEVVDGAEDHFVYEGKRPYEYHERLTNYGSKEPGKGIDQIDKIVKKLCESKEVELDGNKVKVMGYTRRAQAITWRPDVDPELEHPPCLQRVWYRIIDDRLVMETCWRSRDAYKAAFWNIYALTELQKKIAGQVSEAIGQKIEPGAYVDFTNSFHIYEQDFPDIKKRFLNLVNKRSFTERTMKTEDYLKYLKKTETLKL